MDSRIQKAMELEAINSLKKDSTENTATLKSILARLDAMEARIEQHSRSITPPANSSKGGR